MSAAQAPQRRSAWLAPFAVDPRALRALRVGLAALVLADLASRAADLTVFYTDQGVLPREALRDPEATLPPLSLHLLAASPAGVAALFALAALAAVALAVGFHARLAALASSLLAISLQHRNPTLLSGGDQLLALLLLWCSFAPLGRRAARAAPAAPAAPIVSAGTAAIVIQISVVYLSTGLFKLRESPPWLDGTAVALALQDVSVTRLGAALRAHPSLTAGLTWAVLAIELLAPLLILAPVAQAAHVRGGHLRAAAVLALLGLHVGIALTLQVGLFPYVSIVALFPLVPGFVWDRLGLFQQRAPEPPLAGDPPRWSEAVCVFLLALVLWSNLGGLLPAAKPPAPIGAALERCGLAQEWSMYVDLREPSGWFRITGERDGGDAVPLITEGARGVGDDARRYKNLRWHAYMGALARREGLRRLLTSHLCRRDPLLRSVVIRFECEYFCGADADAPPPPPLELVPCQDGAPAGPEGAPLNVR